MLIFLEWDGLFEKLVGFPSQFRKYPLSAEFFEEASQVDPATDQPVGAWGPFESPSNGPTLGGVFKGSSQTRA